MTAALRILSPGVLATIQDLGRPSFQHLGVPVSGALDAFSLRLGNVLLRNDPGAGALEMCYSGLQLEAAHGPVRILVAGPCEGTIEGLAPLSVTPWRSECLRAGDRLLLGSVKNASCAYLIVAGGFRIPLVLGSMSTYTRGSFGGFAGRALAEGDEIPTAAAIDEPEVELPSPPQYEKGPVRIVPGPQDDYFTNNASEVLYGERFTVSTAADRVGIRLDGPRLEHSRLADIPSDGTVHGMIQVPPSGQPIILLNDRQTTGGYPKIGTVITADLPRVGRLVPNQEIHFMRVTPAEAVKIAREREQELLRIIATARAARIQPVLTTDQLLSTNLVGGVVTAFDGMV